MFLYSPPDPHHPLTSKSCRSGRDQKALASFLEFPKVEVDAHSHQDSQEFLSRVLGKLSG